MAKLHGSKFISALLTVLLIGTVALPSLKADAADDHIDPAHPVTLTVTTPEEADMQPLKSIDFPADVWRVASVDENLSYSLLPAFDELQFEGYTLKGEDINNYKNPAAQTELYKVDDLAKALYERATGHSFVKGPSSSPTPQPEEGQAEPPKEPVPPDVQITVHEGTGTADKTTAGAPLLPGYYLIVPEDCTIGGDLYHFGPTLISIPHLGTVKPEEEGAAEYEGWLYAVTARLKPEKTPCRGNVKLVKILNGYNETLEGADFVFTVHAAKDEKTVYSNVISLHFDRDDWADQRMSKEYIIYDLPVGALVEVEEVYAGSAYELVDENVNFPDRLVIAEDPEDPQILTFTFWNSPDGHTHYGSSVLNHYEMVTEEYGHAALSDSTEEPAQTK